MRITDMVEECVPDKPEAAECARCGTRANAVPLTWASSLEDGQRMYYCEQCVRRNVRAIEMRLDTAWE